MKLPYGQVILNQDPITGEYDDADYVYYSTTGSTTPGVTEKYWIGQGFMARTVTAGGVAFNDSYGFDWT